MHKLANSECSLTNELQALKAEMEKKIKKVKKQEKMVKRKKKDNKELDPAFLAKLAKDAKVPVKKSKKVGATKPKGARAETKKNKAKQLMTDFGAK